MISVLEEERWWELEMIFKRDWDCALPTLGLADIVADVDDDGKIHSFIVAEHLLRIGQIHSENGYPRGLFRWLMDHMPANTDVIAVAHKPRDVKICERLGMFRMNEGIVYRRNF